MRDKEMLKISIRRIVELNYYYYYYKEVFKHVRYLSMKESVVARGREGAI